MTKRKPKLMPINGLLPVTFWVDGNVSIPEAVRACEFFGLRLDIAVVKKKRKRAKGKTK